MWAITKLVGVITALATGVLAFGALPALAAEDTDVCSFQGLAGSLTPPIPAITHGSGGTGTYHFDGTGTCVKVDQAESGNSGVYTVSISSDGSYANQLCGTGTADGGHFGFSPASITSTSPGFEGPMQVTYHIGFTAGVGQMTVENFGILGDRKGARTGGTGSGLVSILPTQGGDCILIDVAAFQVTGAFQASV
jgi:hypothetical protein